MIRSRLGGMPRSTDPATRGWANPPAFARTLRVGTTARQAATMDARFLRGVAELRPPPRNTTRADPNVRLLELNVHGHHPKRRPAAHSKGGDHVSLDCGAARRFGLPCRFLVARRDASPHRSRYARVGRILPPSPERCASGLRRGKPDEPRPWTGRDPNMNAPPLAPFGQLPIAWGHDRFLRDEG